MVELQNAEFSPDLEAARDARVFPVARETLSDMAELLISDDPAKKGDFRDLVLKTLQRSVDADLNLTTDTPYLFQVLLSVFSGLNAAVQSATTVAIDEDKYRRVMREILRILADANITLGATPDDMIKEFEPVQAQVSELFISEKMTMTEVKYVMDSIFEAFSATNSMYSTQIERSMAQAEAKLFGVDDMTELSLKRLDAVLIDAGGAEEEGGK